MHRHSPIRKLTGLFAGLLKCWHGHLLNSGTWIRLVLAGRPEQWVHSARLNRCGDERTGFAFDPLSKKKILVLGVCGFVVRGWRGGQRLYRCPRQAARFAARRTVHISMDRPLAVVPCKPRSAAGSLPIGSRPFARWSIAPPGVSGPTAAATDSPLLQRIRQILVRHLP